MSRKTDRLVKELALLFVKYPLSEWQPIMEELRGTSRHSDIADGIERHLLSVAQKKRKQKGTGRMSKNRAAPKVTEGVGRGPRELIAFQEALNSRRALPTPSDLRLAGELIGIKDDLPPDRRQSINRLMAHLSSLREEALMFALTRVAEAKGRTKQDQGAEYERWAALIMNRNSKR